VTDEQCGLLCLDLPRAEALRRARLPGGEAESLAVGARALADPTRLMLAAALGDGDELCVCDLAWVAERAHNLVSHHLRALRSAGLVVSRRDGKMVMYALTERGGQLLAGLLDTRVEVARMSVSAAEQRQALVQVQTPQHRERPVRAPSGSRGS